MTKLKFLVCLIFLCMGCSIANAIMNSNNFMIGCYSYMMSYWSPALIDSICDNMQKAGFNATDCHTMTTSSGLYHVLHRLNDYGMDAIVDDNRWELPTSGLLPPDSLYATDHLSETNYQRFEAEYADATDFNNDVLNDTKYYCSNSNDIDRVGHLSPPSTSNPSNGYSWICDQNDTAGYAYTDLVYRWATNGDYTRIGPEFKFINSANYDASTTPPGVLDNLYLNNNHLILTVDI